MNDPHSKAEESRPAQDAKIVVDEDWKSQVAKEKESLAQEPGQAGAAAAEERRAEMPEASFNMLVTTLATQATLALGQPSPEDENLIQVDLAMAKHLIDTLGILEAKTQGNLTPEESQMLSSVLYQLRMAFVAVRRQLGQQPAEATKKSSIELP
jgi:hypothetical protein